MARAMWFEKRILAELRNEPGLISHRQPRTTDERVASYEKLVGFLRKRIEEEHKVVAALQDLIAHEKAEQELMKG